jgi:pimeloyl-ACP methyl ester carboxylesterase
MMSPNHTTHRHRKVLRITFALLVVLASCGNAAVITEDGKDIQFRSGDFNLVGDLHLPESAEPHPAVIIVHGDGPQTRTSTPGTRDVIRIFGEAGFAVFAWDKPGSGASTGEFDQERTLRQRAEIVTDAVQVLVDHPAIDSDRIGLWGISQAGWVMPLALEQTDDVAFMIVVSGGGEDSIEQLAYQLGQGVVCDGLSPEEGRLVEEHFPPTAKGPSYEEYARAMDALVEIDGWEQFAGPALKTEEEWQPWPDGIDAYFNPMTVIENTTIPVLAIFGEMDRWIDPVQGAAAYEEALSSAGNQDFHVELIPGAGHTMQKQTSMCGGGGSVAERYLELLEEWANRFGRA